MRIAFVMDDVGEARNGTALTCLRYAAELRRQGHEVRLVAHGAGPANTPDGSAFPVPKHEPFLPGAFAARQDFLFARPDPAVFARAFRDVDVIHVFMPFELGRAALRWGRAHEVPVSAAFHVQPENVTYNAFLQGVRRAPDVTYALFRSWLYDRVRHVHCPSEMIADTLRAHGYRARLHVISNGVPDEFAPDPSARPFADDLFHVLTVGRLAPEKDQETLLRAVALSRHADRIQVHVAGAGGLERRLRAVGSTLPHPPDIAFRAHDDLIDLMRACDLYVHPSVADIEAMSCLEAVACGLVPVIARSDASAASQFALDGRSVFPARDARALADRIDWWVEHPAELRAAVPAYAREGDRYRIAGCVEKFVRMEEQAAEDDRRAYAEAAARRD